MVAKDVYFIYIHPIVWFSQYDKHSKPGKAAKVIKFVVDERRERLKHRITDNLASYEYGAISVCFMDLWGA